MTIEGIRNTLHKEAQRFLDRRTRRTACIVDSYNPEQHTVKVKIVPDETISGWVQVETPQIGMLIAPNINDPGWLEFHEDDKRAPVFVGSTHNNNFPIPQQIQAGEFYYKNKASGASIYLKNDGTITIIDKAGSTVLIDGTGNAKVTAQSIQLGNGGTLQQLVNAAFENLFNTHTHPSDGSPPSQQMSSTHLTSVLKAQ